MEALKQLDSLSKRTGSSSSSSQTSAGSEHPNSEEPQPVEVPLTALVTLMTLVFCYTVLSPPLSPLSIYIYIYIYSSTLIILITLITDCQVLLKPGVSRLLCHCLSLFPFASSRILQLFLRILFHSLRPNSLAELIPAYLSHLDTIRPHILALPSPQPCGARPRSSNTSSAGNNSSSELTTPGGGGVVLTREQKRAWNSLKIAPDFLWFAGIYIYIYIYTYICAYMYN